MRLHRALPLILVLAALPAQATTIYTSYSSFQAATSAFSLSDILVSGLIGTTGTTIGPVNGVTLSGTTSNALLVAASPSGWPAGGIVKNTVNGQKIDVTLPSAVVGFGAYFGYQSCSTCLSLTLSYSGGSYDFTPGAATTPRYVGVVFDAPVSTFTIAYTDVTSLNKQLAISNLSVAETPEGPTYLLVGLGLIFLPLLKRRMLRHSLQAQAVAQTQ